jgi:hypothetical protein
MKASLLRKLGKIRSIIDRLSGFGIRAGSTSPFDGPNAADWRAPPAPDGGNPRCSRRPGARRISALKASENAYLPTQ